MYCKFCGKIIDDGSNYCPHCGVSVKFVLTTTEADLFTERMRKIEEKTYVKEVSSLSFIVITKDKGDIIVYDNSLASCNMTNISYVLVVHDLDFLLGIYNDQLEQVSSIPVNETIEIFDVVYTGSHISIKLKVRNPKTLLNVELLTRDECIGLIREYQKKQ